MSRTTQPRPGSICVTSGTGASPTALAVRACPTGSYTGSLLRLQGLLHGCMYFRKRVRGGGNDLPSHRGLLMRVLSSTDSSRAWLVALRRAKGACCFISVAGVCYTSHTAASLAHLVSHVVGVHLQIGRIPILVPVCLLAQEGASAQGDCSAPPKQGQISRARDVLFVPASLQGKKRERKKAFAAATGQNVDELGASGCCVATPHVATGSFRVDYSQLRIFLLLRIVYGSITMFLKQKLC